MKAVPDPQGPGKAPENSANAGVPAVTGAQQKDYVFRIYSYCTFPTPPQARYLFCLSPALVIPRPQSHLVITCKENSCENMLIPLIIAKDSSICRAVLSIGLPAFARA